MYKLDEDNYCPTNCFPARNLLQPKYEEGAGHWQVARQMVEKARIEWLLGTRAEPLRWPVHSDQPRSQKPEKILNKVQLIKLHHVKQPSDLCAVNISHQNFALAKEGDFEEFDSVAYINATENLLTLDIFRKFPGLRELELSLNALRNIKISFGDFPHLEILDLSYNNLSPKDVQVLGVLPRLKVLHLTANGLTCLPLDLVSPESDHCLRFRALEVLLLDDNHLSHPNVFVSLASLRRLKQLNLDKNGIKEVPYLHHIDSTHFSIHPLSAKSGIRAGLHSRQKAAKQLRLSPGLSEESSYIIVQNSKDPDRTEVIFPVKSPETQKHSPLPHADPEASDPDVNAEFILPLPELRFLSLANNQIEHEEELLAVALFPSLVELTFYGNPFITARSGDPPLLTSFLQNKLGIKLVRKKISKLEKPHVFIPNKANRKVKSQLPKVQKQPFMLEMALETTFWQLWTAADLDSNKRLSLDEDGHLPSVRSDSLPSDSERPILRPLRREERSAPLSLTSSLMTEGPTSETSHAKLLPGTPPPSQSSWDQLLPRHGLLPQSSLDQSLPESSLDDYSGSAALTEPFSTEQLLPEPPSSLENVSEFSRTPSAGQLLQTQLETVPPPTSPSEEQDLSKTLPPVGSVEEQGQSVMSLKRLSSEQREPRLVLSPEPVVGTQDLGESLSSLRALSTEKTLQEDFPPARSPTAERDEQEPLLSSRPSKADSLERDSSAGSSARELPESPLPTPSGEGPPLPPTVVPQGLCLSASAENQERPEAPPPSSSTGTLGQGETLLAAPVPLEKTSSPLQLLPTRSISSELYQLFTLAHSYALPPESEEDTSGEEEALSRRGTGGVMEDERSDPIFITQVEETAGSQLSPAKDGVAQTVPEKYKGYEELLGGDPGADFVEPVGIQQNVQALEKALRYPLAYRDAKARLDRCRKPYVPAKKKVLRVPSPKVQKTRMERLEEILLELRKPTNIVHVPLGLASLLLMFHYQAGRHHLGTTDDVTCLVTVCVLRRRKGNWHEYREALRTSENNSNKILKQQWPIVRHLARMLMKAPYNKARYSTSLLDVKDSISLWVPSGSGISGRGKKASPYSLHTMNNFI